MGYSKKLIAASGVQYYRNGEPLDSCFKKLLEKGKSIGQIQDYLQTPRLYGGNTITLLLHFIRNGCFQLLRILYKEVV